MCNRPLTSTTRLATCTILYMYLLTVRSYLNIDKTSPVCNTRTPIHVHVGLVLGGIWALKNRPQDRIAHPAVHGMMSERVRVWMCTDVNNAKSTNFILHRSKMAHVPYQ